MVFLNNNMFLRLFLYFYNIFVYYKNKLTMKLVIYTHTDFLEIFKIQQQHILNLGIELKNIILFSNVIHPSYKFTTICYDENKTYPVRIYECIKQINSLEYEYFLLCHDNDIIISYVDDDLDIITTKMKEHNIGRIDLCVQFWKNSRIKIVDNIEIIKNYDFYLFSVGPSIWNFATYLDIIQNNLYTTYRNIEHYATNYMKNKYNVYNIYSTSYKSYLNRYFINSIGYLHITGQGKITDDPNSEYNDYKKKITSHLGKDTFSTVGLS